MARVRCAVYTRKSSEEGLEQDFNSLDAQREACEAYIVSQRQEGWTLLPDRYDDGGISGGHTDRPALQRLMQDVDAGRVDQIVVYKIDRLTRSLADFAKLVDRLDAANASFVSVTQSFNTATSMGRLTLNVLLSFAQFEREVTAERIRDKIAASKQKGLWMGGYVPLGYDAAGRTLTINSPEAETVRKLFGLYEKIGSLPSVAVEAERLGLRSKRYVTLSGNTPGGHVMSRGHIHKILTNPIYAGKIAHKGKVFEGRHPAIIDLEHWERVQQRLISRAPVVRGSANSGRPSAALTGKIFDLAGDRLSPVHTKKQGKRYDYYISKSLKVKSAAEHKGQGWRLSARAFEQQIDAAIRKHLSAAIPRGLLPNADAQKIAAAARQIGTSEFDALVLVKRIQIGERQLNITLCQDTVAARLNESSSLIEALFLTFCSQFTLRRRGVETKLIIQGGSVPRDNILILNVARAQAWLSEIQHGRTKQDIATENGLSIKRIQQILEFAFLSPEIVQSIIDGSQPSGFTTDWCLTHEIPASWSKQSQVLKRL